MEMTRGVRTWLMMVGGSLVLGLTLSKAPTSFSGAQKLTVKEDARQVVLSWSGPVQEPMSKTLAEALERYEDDPRRLILSLHSPGGQVQHGHQVIKVMRKASYKRAIETVVEAGNTCASMCVPIYLTGAERMAHPGARFMFHEVSFRPTAETEQALRDIERQAPGINVSSIKRQAAEHFTNELFDEDIATKAINARWLEGLRRKIRGRDVWLTGQQLVDEGSGVVFTLLKK